MKRCSLLCAAVSSCLCACGDRITPRQSLPSFTLTSDEAWDRDNDPALFGLELDYELAALPEKGEVATLPWVGSYWPTASDSINHRWDGPTTDSPARKYGLAFGVEGVEDAVSRTLGIASITEAKTCTRTRACAEGELCGKRADEAEGRCVPAWWGVCDAWAAASILVPEPKVAVTHGGVKFKPDDIKALVTVVHKNTEAAMVSLRCDDKEEDIQVDESGRPTNKYRACRDANPGTYHVLLANVIGKQHKPFIEDETWDAAVWNYPLRGYRVLDAHNVSVAEANRLLQHNAESYTYNPAAERLVYVQTNVFYIGENLPRRHRARPAPEAYTYVDGYEYILELDHAGKIVGGEWVGDSKHSHPDFAWLPRRAKRQGAAGGLIRYDDVMQLAAESSGGH